MLSGDSLISRSPPREMCAPAAHPAKLNNDSVPHNTGAATAIRNRSAWILLASILLFAAMATPHFLGMIYAADDLWAFHLPVRAFYADCLERGVAFDWMPQLYSGFYVTGEGQGGFYHPLHWLLYRTLPLRSAFNLEILLPYPLLFAGMFCWLRRRILRIDAALFGALCFTFGSFSLLHFVHPNAMAIVAHLPWCLWAVDVAFTAKSHSKRSLAGGGLALLTASQLLLGYPQYVWFSLLATGCYALWLAMRPTTIRRWRTLAWTIAFLSLGAVAGAVQLLPTFDALAHSTRNAADSEFANSGALHIANLAQVVAPYALQTRVFGNNTHELGCYLGAVPLVLLLWLATHQKQLPRRYRRLAIVASTFAGVSLLLCLGQAGGLYTLQTKLPIIGRFRLPARYLVLVNLAVSVLGAIAFASVTHPPRKTRSRQANVSHSYLGVIAASLVTSLVIFAVWRTDRAASVPLVLIGPALVAMAAWLVCRVELRRRVAVPLLILFTALDLGVYGLTYAIWPGTATPRQAQAAVKATSPTQTTGRILVDDHGSTRDQLRTGNQAILSGAMLADGYAGLEPADALPLDNSSALRIAGVSLISNQRGNADIVGLEQTDDASWLAIPHPLPRARLVGHSVVADEADVATALSGIDPAHVAIVDRQISLESKSPRDESGVVNRKLDEPGRICLAVAAPGRQLLIVNERFHPGWQVTVNGQAVDVVRVYGQYLGCVVDRDTHQVEFSFRPRSLRSGKWISLGGLALILAVTLARLPRRKRPDLRSNTPGNDTPPRT
ncbi:MAG: YfhO family protein [Pirellulales bacterium]|nr:YfhO family protein [Pirellulales bacterium]